jgi:beta-lactamase regulating signal transducer with metallopeptidase domain
MTSPLILVPFAAVFVGLALVGACAVALASRLSLLSAPESQAPSSLPRALFALAPVIIAVLGCAALASPNPFAACHCTEHGLHHPHLCLRHPGFALPLLIPAACILGAWAIVVAPRVLRLARDVIASERWVRAARRLPLRRVSGVPIRLADDVGRVAFTVGVLTPTIVFDRALWLALSDEERRAVAHHEDAHVKRRDGLTLLALRMCAALCPVLQGARVLEGWRSAVEMACDAHAAETLGDPAAVAGALVAVERARANLPDAPAAAYAPALGIVAGGDLERRVRALLAVEPTRRRRSTTVLGSDLLAVSLVVIGAAALTVAWPGDSFHHATETLIGLFVH